MKHRVGIVIPYFGDWPVWINFFVESCRTNSTIDWIIFNDRPPPDNRSPNVRHIRITFDEYKELLSDALGVHVGATEPYKLCDIRPALGFVHGDLLRDFDFVGFGDLDVIYGDIRSFYDDRLLAEYDLLFPAALYPPFVPNMWIDISDSIDRKLEAWDCYRSQHQQGPTPRSPEALRALAVMRGAEIGAEAAEGFLVLRIVTGR